MDSIYRTAFHDPGGGTDRYFRMRSPQNAACTHPTGLKVAARTAFANAGSMRAVGWIAHSTWNGSPALYRQRSADPTKNRTELYIPSCFLLFV